MRLKCLLALALCAVLALPASADAYSNGRFPSSALAPINHPSVHVALARPSAAAWNTMRICAVRQGRDLYPGGPRSAYRDYAGQLYFWNLYRSGRGNLAAYPGTSNHGWGNAVDLATPVMRSYINTKGGTYRWRKTEAFSEWWHVNYTGGWSAPNPGVSARYPVLRSGSGRACLTSDVREVQRRLRLTTDGDFGPATARSVRGFQRRNHLHPDGIVGYQTWVALRRSTRAAQAVQTPKAPMTLTVGHVGADVRTIQGLLNTRHKEVGSPWRVEVDGRFGPKTAKSVRSFQRQRHLRVTGLVDRATYLALRRPAVKNLPVGPRASYTRYSPNRSPRVGGLAAIRGYVVHTTEGNGTLVGYGAFFRPPREVSVQTATDAWGKVGRYVLDRDKAWHASCWNNATVGNENIGFASATRAFWLGNRRRQLDAQAALISAAATKYHFPIQRGRATFRYIHVGWKWVLTDCRITKPGVFAHGDLDPRNRHDPGANFPWDYVLNRARTLQGSG